MLDETAVGLAPTLRIRDRLDIAMLEQATGTVSVVVDDEAMGRITAARQFVLDAEAAGRQIYGVTSGLGSMAAFTSRKKSVDDAENTLNQLTSGHGVDLPRAIVRATMLVRLSSFAKGRSAVSPDVVNALAAMLGTDFTPAVPRLGSVGASGDLVPMAHATQALRGNGFAYLGTVRMPAAEALHKAGLTPLRLDGRDALGLVNGTSLSVAAAGLALASMSRSLLVAQVLSAVMADILGSSPGYLQEDLLMAYGHEQAIAVGSRMRDLLSGTTPSGDRGFQEPYSIRCVPQLVGAAAASIDHVRSVVAADLNGISDNPVFFPETGEIAHGGNFFGQPVAFATDLLTNVAAQMGNLAERQLDLMIDPHRNGGMPPMLATVPGEQHGVQGVQIVATATVADMRRNAVPASMQSLPTNLHAQDVVPFGTQAALNAFEQTRSLRWLHGALAIGLRQSVHVGGRRPTAPACATIVDRLSDLIPPIDPDRPLDEDVPRAADLLDTIADELGIAP